MLVARQVVGGKNNVALTINAEPADRPVGTAGLPDTNGPALTARDEIARGNEDLVGRPVRLEGIRVGDVAQRGGFFARDSDASVFVLPAGGEQAKIRAGETVSIQGVILQMPRAMEDRLDPPANANDDIYVFATNITR